MSSPRAWGYEEGVAAGIYPQPGSAEERSISREVQGISGRGTPSDLFTSATGSSNSYSFGDPAEAANAADLGGTVSTPEINQGMNRLFSGGTNNSTSTAFEGGAGANFMAILSEFVPRLAIIILGFVFVAAGLYMFRGGNVINVATSSLARGKGT